MVKSSCPKLDSTKIQAQYTDMSYWVLNVNHQELKRQIFTELIFKKSRLTGNEVRAIRLYFEMRIPEFGQRFNVSHVAVLKWEAQGDFPTKMRWPQEKDIRQQVIYKLGGDMRRAYEELRLPAADVPSPVSVVMSIRPD